MNVECLLTAGQLRASFERRGDRIAHTIELAVGDATVVLLESCEGSAEEHWPASPPVQELERAPSAPASQPLDAGTPQVAWLIGRAGASHWSASVEANADGSITFDMACRLREKPVWLGSHYRVLADGASSGLAIETLDGCQLATAADSHADSRISIAAEVPDGEFPRTIRWRYRLAWRG
jgi:hypothetical protein